MKKEFDDSAAWFVKADADWQLAQRAMAAPPLTELACYHAQQCAEKCLKGFLTAKGLRFKWLHDLAYLVEICAQSDGAFEDLAPDAVKLTRLAAPSRYPGVDEPPVSIAEATQGLRIAQRIREFVLEKMGK